jgi:hypothetical protein
MLSGFETGDRIRVTTRQFQDKFTKGTVTTVAEDDGGTMYIPVNVPNTPGFTFPLTADEVEKIVESKVQVGDYIRFNKIPGVTTERGFATVLRVDGDGTMRIKTDEVYLNDSEWWIGKDDVLEVIPKKAEEKFRVGDTVDYAGEHVAVIGYEPEEHPYWPYRIKYEGGFEGLVKETEISLVKRGPKFQVGARVILNNGASDASAFGIGTVTRNDGKTYPYAVDFDNGDRLNLLLESEIAEAVEPEPTPEPERVDHTDLVERADMLINAHKITGGEQDYTAQTLTELRDALVEESYR